MSKANYPQWNYQALLAALGDARAIVDKIKARGYDAPPLKTISGWKTRGLVPSRWSPLIIQIGLDEGLLRSISALAASKPKRAA